MFGTLRTIRSRHRAEAMLSSLGGRPLNGYSLWRWRAVLLQKDEEPFYWRKHCDGRNLALIAGKRVTIWQWMVERLWISQQKRCSVNIQDATKKAGYTADDIDLYLLHQSKSVSSGRGCRRSKNSPNTDHVGNTSAKYSWTGRKRDIENRRVYKLSGFGGLTWNAPTAVEEKENIDIWKIQAIIVDQLKRKKYNVTRLKRQVQTLRFIQIINDISEFDICEKSLLKKD